MNQYTKPLPEPSSISKPFWDAVRQHKLSAQKCSSCSKFRHVPRPFCPYCFSEKYSWVPLSGQGTVYTYTIMHRPPGPGFEKDVPLLVALVELKEGIRMVSNIVGCPPDRVRVGMRVKAAYEDINDQVTLFKFTPA